MATSLPMMVKNPSTGNNCKSGRRVAFEVPSRRRSSLSDINSSMEHLDNGRRHPCCFAWCAWACIAFFILIITLLFAGISYLAFLQSSMPTVNVRALNITKLSVDHSEKMDAVISLGLRFTNKNDKLVLLYGSFNVFVNSEGVELGSSKVGRFKQKPRNETDFDLRMNVKDADVNRYAVEDLKSDIKAKEMEFDVYVDGKVGIKFGSLDMINVPYLASCRQILKTDVDLGRRPQCDVKMFAVKPSTN